MPDTLQGPVTTILDGGTFRMRVISSTGAHNYNPEETIRIEGVDAPETGSLEGDIAKGILAVELPGKSVVVTVHARDDYGRVVGSYEIIETDLT